MSKERSEVVVLGRERGSGGCRPRVYVPLKAHFLVFSWHNSNDTHYQSVNIVWKHVWLLIKLSTMEVKHQETQNLN